MKLPGTVKVRAELISKLNNGNADMNESCLPYLTVVCQETLRIYPIAIIAFPRMLNSPMQINGYEFSEG